MAYRGKNNKRIATVALVGSVLWFDFKQKNYIVLRFDKAGDAVLIKCDRHGTHAKDAAPFHCGWMFDRLRDKVIGHESSIPKK